MLDKLNVLGAWPLRRVVWLDAMFITYIVQYMAGRLAEADRSQRLLPEPHSPGTAVTAEALQEGRLVLLAKV